MTVTEIKQLSRKCSKYKKNNQNPLVMMYVKLCKCSVSQSSLCNLAIFMCHKIVINEEFSKAMSQEM